MADRTCSMEGCERAHRARGFCDAHLQRYYRSGDPKGSGKAVWGEGLKWIEGHKDYAEQGCLIWPFGRGGYPAVYVNGKKVWAHRYMCELAHGAPPSDRHEAAHSCGRGNFGCIAPLHLRWATPEQNSADKRLHGTSNQGARNPMAKLDEQKVREIRAATGKHKDIAKAFGIARGTVGDIKAKKRWADIA